MPEVIAGILSDSFKREKVLSQCDASEVLREAFYQTEARINHYYEVSTQNLFSYFWFFIGTVYDHYAIIHVYAELYWLLNMIRWFW